MKTLLILRHAKSSWKDPSLDDHERPLNKRGQRDAPRIGHLLRQESLSPDLIVSSTANRARTTAETVAGCCDYEKELQYFRDLYLADADTWIERLREISAEVQCVLIVGHNPGLEVLLELLTDEDESLPTAALAQVELPMERWMQLDRHSPGRLVALWRPRELQDNGTHDA